MIFPRRTFGPQLYRWTRPCFSLTANLAAHEPNHPNGVFRPIIQRPNAKLRPVTRRFLGRFRPVFSAPKAPEFWADKPFTRCLGRPAEWSFRNPLGSTGGDPNTLAPNRLKTRTTPLRPSRTSTSS